LIHCAGGHGTIDCGPGEDTGEIYLPAERMLAPGTPSISNCETVTRME
jgi:hypothetical protein